MREYRSLQILRGGGILVIEGIRFRMAEGDLQIGDWYIAERNVGPKLSTVSEITKEGWVFGEPKCSIYPYDKGECVKVEPVDL